MTTFTIYCYLFAVATCYAVLLSWLRHLWEPDLTWLEVVIGVFICLLAPYLDQRWHGPLDSATYEWRVWEAFIVGGAPVIFWQIGQSVRARLRVERRIRGKNGNTWHTAQNAADVAEESGASPEADD